MKSTQLVKKMKKRLPWLGLPIVLTGVLSFSLLNYGNLTIDSYDQNDYTSELVKAYGKLSGYTNNSGPFTILELTTDELVVPARGADWYDGGNYIRLHQHSYTKTEDYFNWVWQQYYSGIVVCNRQLFHYSKVTTTDVNQYKAELRVLRAFYYYLLLDAFRNVPIVVDYFPASPGLPAQNTSQEVFNFIESEINANLSTLSVAKVYGRFNQSGAKAILAKLYLNANVYIGQTKWTQAKAVCDDIVNSGIYNLTADYFDNFKVTNNTSSEIIFQIPYDAATLEGFYLGQMTLHYASQATFNLQSQPWNGYTAVEDFYNSFASNDLRKGQFLVGPQVDINNNPLLDPGVEAADPDGPQINFTPAINELYPNALRQAGARINKWKYEIGAGISLNNDFAIFRYADILLMKAEAEFRLGNLAVALTLVNQIRVRSGLAPLAGPLVLSDILSERGKEFFAETWRRQDLIRFGAYNAAWWQKPASSAYVNIFPIPAAQITANPNLLQNPGY